MRPGQIHRLAAHCLLPVGIGLGAIERLLLSLPMAGTSTPVPLVFIVGPPRSGTTIAFQCLTRALNVSYPSHACALFPQAPALSLRLWEMLYRRPHHAFQSLHGYSLGDGLRGPNEWETFFHSHVFRLLRSGATKVPGLDRLSRGTLRWGARPVLIKALNVSLHIGVLARQLPQARFLWVSRDPVAVARSIYRAKRREGMDASVLWYVTDDALGRTEFATEAEQIAAQILWINRAIERDFAALPASHRACVHYNALCADPEAEVRRLARWLGPDVAPRSGGSLPRLQPPLSRPLDDPQIEQIFHALLGCGADDVRTSTTAPTN